MIIASATRADGYKQNLPTELTLSYWTDSRQISSKYTLSAGVKKVS